LLFGIFIFHFFSPLRVFRVVRATLPKSRLILYNALMLLRIVLIVILIGLLAWLVAINLATRDLYLSTHDLARVDRTSAALALLIAADLLALVLLSRRRNRPTNPHWPHSPP